MAWQDYETKLVSRDADVSQEKAEMTAGVEGIGVDREYEEYLQNLGYMDAG